MVESVMQDNTSLTLSALEQERIRHTLLQIALTPRATLPSHRAPSMESKFVVKEPKDRR